MFIVAWHAADEFLKDPILKYTDFFHNKMKSWWQKFYPIG